MNYWLISDTHFNHEKLTEWGGRSGDWQEQLWEGMAAIPDDDVLIHLGDICIGADALVHESIALLRCKKILVRGNHDKKGILWYSEHGWDFVVDGLELVYQGHYLHLTHRPARPQGNTTWNIHGHTHGNLHRSEEYVDFYSPQYHIDISPEIVGYKPVRLDTLLKKK
jgi:calcineurin-like phosphoesterase family protein